MNTPDQFNAAYFAAQPLTVQLLMKTTQPNSSERIGALEALAAGGASLDPQILEMGLPPFWVMQARIWYGFPPGGWVPAIGQKSLDAFPGQFIEGETLYDPSAHPPGSIVVVDPANCDLAATYPPVVPPAAAPTPSVPAPVGPFVGELFPGMTVLLTPAQRAAGMVAYKALNVNDGVPEGTEVTENGKVFTKGLFRTFATGIPYYMTKGQQ